MFRKPGTASLSLAIGRETFSFRSPRDLEFALSGKAGPSTSRAAALVHLADEALLREREHLSRMEQRLAQALAGGDGAADAAGRFLRELDLSLVAEDNDWRAIIYALNALDGSYEGYKRAALAKYLEYLRSGRELITSIYSNRRPRRAARADAADAAGGVRQTLIRDPAVLAPPAEPGLHRLPKGAAVEVRFEPHGSLDLLLGRHHFLLVAGAPFLLVDEHGDDLKLRAGRNIVGRSLECEVVVERGFRAVSRRHLVVECAAHDRAVLTDISTLGTFAALELHGQRLH